MSTNNNNNKDKPTNEQELRALIEQMLVEANPYLDHPNRRMPLAWAVGVLTRLLSYSAQNQMEVRARIKQLIQRGPGK